MCNTLYVNKNKNNKAKSQIKNKTRNTEKKNQ